MTVQNSKIAAWAALLIVIVCLVLTFSVDRIWWTYADIFFAFMMTFLHLMAVYTRKLTAISRQLDLAALICGALMIVALVVEFIFL